MTCVEFQRALPYIVEGGGNTEEEQHLRSCPVCSDLVQDLKYIAEAAKLLLPMEEPSPRVWQNISRSLEHEGVQPRARWRMEKVWTRPKTGGWWTGVRVGAVAAVLAIMIAVFAYVDRTEPGAVNTAGVSGGQSAAPPPAVDHADQQLLAELAPAVRPAYEESLRSVNAYIRDAERTLAENPESDAARAHLMEAHEQKAMLYDMAMSSSLQ